MNLSWTSRKVHVLIVVNKALFILANLIKIMIDFLTLSIPDKILVALAVLKKNRSHQEVTKWINKMCKHFLKTQKIVDKKDTWSEGRIQLLMSGMLAQRYGKQKEFVLELQKVGKKFTYKGGKYTVNSRLGALVIFLLWEIYNENSYSLTEEQAIKIAENNEEEIKKILKNSIQVDTNIKWQRIKWFTDEIKNEKSSIHVLDWKFDSILKADYFRRVKLSRKKPEEATENNLEEKEGFPILIMPTDRLTKHEKSYIESLIYLLPELEAIENQSKLKQQKGN